MNLEKALNEWQGILGSESIIKNDSELGYFQNTTYKTENKPLAVLYPKDTREVSECVKIANKYLVPIYSISRGNNWGYGSRIASKDGCVILCLEKMNKILECNETLAYMTVEPGVSFKQAYQYLNERGLDVISPAIGSTKDASLIGNALERGVGKSIFGDRFNHCCNMEVVLPNGDIINTGFGNIENVKSKNVFKWGLGPVLDGLFSQSNFGIVTKMTFWLTRKPKHFQMLFFTIKNKEQLSNAIDCLRELRLEGTISTTSTLSNYYRILSMKQKFPFDKFNENEQLSKEYADKFKEDNLNGAMWFGDDGILSATKQIGKARAKRIKQVLGKAVDKVIIIDGNKAKILGILAKPIKLILGVDVKDLIYFYYNSFYLGKPMEKQLAICYWRMRMEPSENIDIDKDRCGVISLNPSIPFTGEDVTKGLEIVERVFAKYGFEPNFGLNFMNDRHLLFVHQILYDRKVAGHDEKAMECYNEVTEELLKAGYPPYRLGVQSMDKMFSTSKEYVDFVNSLKRSIDPNNIISPSHYGITG
jgi:4-cresol dehydrogenase (hydroxylating)